MEFDVVLQSLLTGTGVTSPSDVDYNEYFNSLKLIVPELYKRKMVTPSYQLLAHATLSRALQLLYYRMSKYACPLGRNEKEKEMIELIEASHTDDFHVPDQYIKHVYCSCFDDKLSTSSSDCSCDVKQADDVTDSRLILTAKRRLALKSFEPDTSVKPMTDEEVVEIGSAHLSDNPDDSEYYESEDDLDQDCHNCGSFCVCTGEIKVQSKTRESGDDEHVLAAEPERDALDCELKPVVVESNTYLGDTIKCEDSDYITSPNVSVQISDVKSIAIELLTLPYHNKVNLKTSKREYQGYGRRENLSILNDRDEEIFTGTPLLQISFLTMLEEQNPGVKFKMKQLIELMRIYEWWRESFHIFEFTLESADLSNVPLNWDKHFFMMDVHYPSYMC